MITGYMIVKLGIINSLLSRRQIRLERSMKKIAVIYWSGTGNTEELANSIAEGAKEAGADVNLLAVDSASEEDALSADVIAFGCPATGNEEVEESEMLPYIESLGDKLSDKPMVLFGSHDWGDGEWMENWQDQMEEYGVQFLADPLIVNLEPEASDLEEARALGQKLAE